MPTFWVASSMTTLALLCLEPRSSRSLPKSMESGPRAPWVEASGGSSHQGRRSMTPWCDLQAETGVQIARLSLGPGDPHRT